MLAINPALHQPAVRLLWAYRVKDNRQTKASLNALRVVVRRTPMNGARNILAADTPF